MEVKKEIEKKSLDSKAPGEQQHPGGVREMKMNQSFTADSSLTALYGTTI